MINEILLWAGGIAAPPAPLGDSCDKYKCPLNASVSAAVSSTMVTSFCDSEVSPGSLIDAEDLSEFVAVMSYICTANLGACSKRKQF